jgi:hypothetical protein
MQGLGTCVDVHQHQSPIRQAILESRNQTVGRLVVAEGSYQVNDNNSADLQTGKRKRELEIAPALPISKLSNTVGGKSTHVVEELEEGEEIE